MKKFRFWSFSGSVFDFTFDSWSEAAKYFYDRKHFYTQFKELNQEVLIMGYFSRKITEYWECEDIEDFIEYLDYDGDEVDEYGFEEDDE